MDIWMMIMMMIICKSCKNIFSHAKDIKSEGTVLLLEKWHTSCTILNIIDEQNPPHVGKVMQAL